MESSPSSRLSFFIEPGATIASPDEGRTCGIAIDIPRELWPSISLTLAEVALPLHFDETAMHAYSEWPACGPGRYELSLVCGLIRERRTITVMPHYFNESEIGAIIHDLTDQLPKTIASSLQECGALLDANLALDHGTTIQQDLLKLRRALKGSKERLGLLQILPVIQRQPHQVLVTRHEVRDTEKARRPDIAKLPSAISMPGNFSASGALNQMFDITVETSFDTYENSLVKAYVTAMQSQIARLQGRLKSEPAPPAVAAELEVLSSELRLACTRASFLRQVKKPFVSADRVTMVLLKNSAYRAIWEDYLALYKRSTVRLDEPALNDPMNNFPSLYQRWVNLKVVSVMLRVSAELGFQCISLPWVKKDHTGLFIHAVHDFEDAIGLFCPRTGRTIKLIPWRTDNESSKSEHDLPQTVAIAIYAPERPPVVLVFDAKYRVAAEGAGKTGGKKTRAKKATKKQQEDTLETVEPMKEDVDELLYCMEKLKTPGGVREIQYAAILYPGPAKQIAPDLEALTARPLDSESLQRHVYGLLRRYLG
jgi:hypothetical protein